MSADTTGVSHRVGFHRAPPLEQLRRVCDEVRGRTPVIAYDTDGIDAEIDAVLDDLRRVPAHSHRLLFSVKANRFHGVLSHLASRGIGAAVASLEEWRAATNAGMQAVCATAPGLTGDDLRFLQEAGVGVDADSARQLAQLEHGSTVGVRLAVPIDPASTPRNQRWSRFGVRWPSADVATAISSHDLQVARLHAHVRDIGTPDDAEVLGRVLADAAMTLPSVTELNLGGGNTRLRHANSDAVPAAYEMLARSLAVSGRTYHVLAEPGAQLVTAHGYLFTEILDVDVAGGRQLAVLDGSAWNLAGWSRFEPVELVAPAGPVLPTDFAGPTCYEKDLWVTGAQWGGLRPGDVVVLRGAGAYVTSMSRNLHDLRAPTESLLEGVR
jgi:diaminopimelate decarboxylase